METKNKLDDILERSKNINANAISREVLEWLINNVELFIDNHEQIFKLDFSIQTEDEMPNTKILQNLYMDIPDDYSVLNSEDIKDISEALENGELDRVSECRRELDKITKTIFEILQSEETKELRKELFSKMIYYYELTTIHNGVGIIKDLVGEVSVLKFEYEAFNVGVKIQSKDKKTGQKIISKEYDIPEGFSVWIEIRFSEEEKPTQLF